jgi:hypothetical protein
MLISHQHRFIFLKTQKTAGTAIEIALRGVMHRGDVITPISAVDERLSRQLGHLGPRHFRATLRQYRRRDWLRLLSRGRLKKRFYNHMPAALVKAELPSALWDGYLKISVERNPFDKAISSYYWRTRKQRQPVSLDSYLLTCPTSEISNWPIYTINDTPVVDVMLRQEQLDQDLAVLGQRLGLSAPLALPRQRPKGEVRRDRRPWQDVLTPACEQRIREVCAREIATFSY